MWPNSKTNSLSQQILILSIVFSMSLFSCNSRHSEIVSLRNDLNKIARTKGNIKHEELERIERKIKEIDYDIERNHSDLTESEIHEFGVLKGRFAALQLKAEIQEFRRSTKEIGDEMEGFFEQIGDSTFFQK
jgi:hypothetical protein